MDDSIKCTNDFIPPFISSKMNFCLSSFGSHQIIERAFELCPTDILPDTATVSVCHDIKGALNECIVWLLSTESSFGITRTH